MGTTAKVHFPAGADEIVVADGGAIRIQSGGEVDFEAGSTLKRGGVEFHMVGGLAAGYKVARGQHETVAASDTVATGLATVVAAVAVLDDDPTVDPLFVTASIGDQAGAPAAGSIYIKSWKPTAVNDVTPVPATTFGKKVNWVAIGT